MRRSRRSASLGLRLLGAVTLAGIGALGAGSPVAASTARTTIQSVRSADTASGTERSAPNTATRNDAQAAAAASAPHIMLILEENESYNAIIGSSSAPYINGLAATYSSATKWYAVQGNSPHDYLDLIVGSDLGLPNGQPYSTSRLE